MTEPAFRFDRRHCIRLLGSSLLFAAGCCPASILNAQDVDKPLLNIDEEVTAFAFAPDGRIVFSARRMFKTKKYDLQRDDIWLQEIGGKRRRLLQGEKFSRSDQPFSYAVDAFRWSPNGRVILAQLFTTALVADSDKAEDEYMTLLLDDSGRELRPAGTDSAVRNAEDASCLRDNATIAYLTENVKPRLLFSFRYTNLSSGPGGPLFEGRTFLASAPIPDSNVAIAVERDRNLSGPPRLQHLDLLAQDDTELATLDNYETGLSVSPTGKLAAYFLDKEVLEVRDLSSPHKVARLRVGLGAVQWSPDETRILLKRGQERKSGDLVWVALPTLAAPPANGEVPVTQPDLIPVFRGLTYRDFAISPDGRHLAVVAPGKRNLLVFPLPR